MHIKNIIFFFLIVITFNGYALKPERKYITVPDSFGINYQNVTIRTPDHAQLYSWVIAPFKGVDRKTTIIIAYGDAGNMSYYLYQAASLAKKGYTVVLFDYRGFGKSSDFNMDSNMLYYNEFVTDLQSVIKWAKLNLNNNKTGVWALSMGTIMATFVTKNEMPDFLICEGYVYSPDTIKARIKEIKNKEIHLPAGAENYLKTINDIKIKMLIFAGIKDKMTTVEDTKKIIGKTSNRKLVTYDGNHLEGFQKLTQSSIGDIYINKIIEFLK